MTRSSLRNTGWPLRLASLLALFAVGSGQVWAQYPVQGRQQKWSMTTVESDGMSWIGGSYSQIDQAMRLVESPSAINMMRAMKERAASTDAVLGHNTYENGRTLAALLTIVVRPSDTIRADTIDKEFGEALAFMAKLDAPQGSEARALGWTKMTTAGYPAARIAIDVSEPSGRQMKRLMHFVFQTTFTHVFQLETHAAIFDRRVADLDRMLRTLRY